MNKIAEFQKQNGLVADGVLGNKTFSKMKEVWKVSSNERLANFLGQTSVETGNFTIDSENLNYSKEGLEKYFAKYFKTEQELINYARQPQRIGNRVYANRMGNRDEKSGDGYKHRGAGSSQVTGADNYKEFSKWVKSPTTLTTEEIATKYFWESGLYYFEKNKLWDLASKVDDLSITKLSKAINLGDRNSKHTPNHLKERIENTKKYYSKMIKDKPKENEEVTTQGTVLPNPPPPPPKGTP